MAKIKHLHNVSLEVTSSMIINLDSHAMHLNHVYGNYIKEPTPGIYKIGEIQPYLSPNVSYYDNEGKEVKINLNDINALSKGINSHYGTLIPAKFAASNKLQDHFSIGPTLPANAYNLLYLLIEEFIIIHSSIPKIEHIPLDRISSIMKEGYEYLVTEGIIESNLSFLFKDIFNFISNDPWHIYFTKLINRDIYIEKTIDYRIYRYHEEVLNGTIME